jgi:hypothetical protein
LLFRSRVERLTATQASAQIAILIEELRSIHGMASRMRSHTAVGQNPPSLPPVDSVSWAATVSPHRSVPVSAFGIVAPAGLLPEPQNRRPRRRPQPAAPLDLPPSPDAQLCHVGLPPESVVCPGDATSASVSGEGSAKVALQPAASGQPQNGYCQTSIRSVNAEKYEEQGGLPNMSEQMCNRANSLSLPRGNPLAFLKSIRNLGNKAR